MSTFVKEKEWLTIGKYKIDISRISAGRVLSNIDRYNRFLGKTWSSEEQTIGEIVGIALNMISIEFSFKRIFDWFKRKLITKRYVLKICTMEELNTFLEECFEPITGGKKKALKKENRMTELGLKIAEKMPEEKLIELLSKSQLLQDGK